MSDKDVWPGASELDDEESRDAEGAAGAAERSAVRPNPPTGSEPRPAPDSEENAFTRSVAIVGNVTVGLLLGLMLCLVFSHDSWQVYDGPRVLGELEKASRLEKSDVLAARKLYDGVLKEARRHTVTDENLAKQPARAQRARAALEQRIQEGIGAEKTGQPRKAEGEGEHVAAEEGRERAAEGPRGIDEEKPPIAAERGREKATPRKAPVAEVPKPADPVALLEELLRRVEHDGTKPRVTDFMGPDRWAKKMAYPVNMQYEIKKTDSPVLPMVATVTWQDNPYISDDFPTREAAEVAPLQDRGTVPKGFRSWATLAFQDGRWIVQDTGWDGPAVGLHKKHSESSDDRDWVYDWWWAFERVGPAPDRQSIGAAEGAGFGGFAIAVAGLAGIGVGVVIGFALWPRAVAELTAQRDRMAAENAALTEECDRLRDADALTAAEDRTEDLPD
jgi:hypothetical protein